MMPINKRINKKTTVYLFSGIQLRKKRKKERKNFWYIQQLGWTSKPFCGMKEAHNIAHLCDVSFMWCLCDSIYVTFKNKQGESMVMGVRSYRGREGGWLWRSRRDLSRVKKIFCVLIWVSYNYQIQLTVHLELCILQYVDSASIKYCSNNIKINWMMIYKKKNKELGKELLWCGSSFHLGTEYPPDTVVNVLLHYLIQCSIIPWSRKVFLGLRDLATFLRSPRTCNAAESKHQAGIPDMEL